MQRDESVVRMTIGVGLTPDNTDITLLLLGPGQIVDDTNRHALSGTPYHNQIGNLNRNQGFGWFRSRGVRQLAVVVISDYETGVRNIRALLENHEKELYGARIWIPLYNNPPEITLHVSYDVLREIIDSEGQWAHINATFVIALPNNNEGKVFYKDITGLGAPVTSAETAAEPIIKKKEKKAAPPQKKTKAAEKKAPTPEPEPEAVPPVIVQRTTPGILSDLATGDDYLDISKDYNAFARVIASKDFEPPLAIALLGKWGSGKSFFMEKLYNSIDGLAKERSGEAFCKGIAHVHFNAWSYMDANLWASFVTRIFEGLEDYLKDRNIVGEEKKAIETQLFQKLNITKEALQVLEKQKQKAADEITVLKDKRDKLSEELESKITGIRRTSLKQILDEVDTAFKVEEKIGEALARNPSYIDSAEKFEKIVPKQYWENPSELYRQLTSFYTFIRAFFSPLRWKDNLLWLVCLLIIIFGVPAGGKALGYTLSITDFSLSNAQWLTISIGINTLSRVADTVLMLKKQLAPFWAIKEKYESARAEAIFTHEQEEKALRLEIENTRQEIILLDQHITQQNETKADLEFRLNNAISTQALYSFIEKKAGGDDYTRHLGMVSLVRKDLEILSGLLTGHKTDLVTNRESAEFKAIFKQPLERIVLYIDDLDRCPEERVVEVLEAVNLLMAFRLFVVVVGVDPRWVKNALIKKHRMQFTGYNDGEKEKDAGIELIDASSYLEKIFQIPFTLKDASDAGIRNMIDKLARNKADTNQNTDRAIVGTESNGKAATENDATIFGNGDRIAFTPGTQDAISKPATVEQINALVISDAEIEQIKEFSRMIGNSPRLVKRFVNVYRIIKTHEDFELDAEASERELLLVMFLLAFCFGIYKDLVPGFENFMDAYDDTKVLRSFFNAQTGGGSAEETGKKQRIKDLTALLGNSAGKLYEMDTASVRKHYQFIRRFTFKNI